MSSPPFRRTCLQGTDELEKLAIQIKEDFEAGKELVVSVMSVSACVCGWLVGWKERGDAGMASSASLTVGRGRALPWQ